MVPIYETWHRPKTVQEFQLSDDGETKYKRTDILGRRSYLLNGHLIKDSPNPNRTYKKTRKIVDNEETGEMTNIPVGHGKFPACRQIAYQVQDKRGRKGLYDVMGILETDRISAVGYETTYLGR